MCVCVCVCCVLDLVARYSDVGQSMTEEQEGIMSKSERGTEDRASLSPQCSELTRDLEILTTGRLLYYICT